MPFLQWLQYMREIQGSAVASSGTLQRRHLVAMFSLQARHAALLTQRMMGAGEAASHRVGANQQQEVVPADRGGSVGLVMRCAK